jgi:hypothetical protein
MTRKTLYLCVAAAVAVAPVVTALGQSNFQTSTCNNQDDSRSFSYSTDHRYSHCEVRTIKLAAGQALEVTAVNGGISVIGEGRGDIQLEARIQTWGDSQADADKRAQDTTIQTANNHVRADTPRNWHGQNSEAVSFRVLVPHRYSVKLDGVNGGISVADLEGTMNLHTENGGISLKNCAGDVHARTTNGGISITADGESWRGGGVDAETTNGSASITLPPDYSAHLEAGVVNGSIRFDFPLTMNHFNSKEISTDIGKGGSTLRLHTVNGSVSIHRGKEPS